jgi:ribonuclease P protein subunit RPR2
MNPNAIALSRCRKLILLAREVYADEPALAKRYISLARKIAMRHRIPLGKKDFCRRCGTVFIPGVTLRVRVSPSKTAVLYTCISCTNTANFAYAREKASRKHPSR